MNDLSSTAVVTLDARGEIRDWSEPAVHLFGYGSAEIEGHPASILLPGPDNHLRLSQDLEASSATGRVNRRRWHLRQDGCGILLDASVMPLRLGQRDPAGFILLLRPSAARSSGLMTVFPAELAAAFDGLPEAVLVGDQRSIIHANPVARRCFGITGQEPLDTREFLARQMCADAPDPAQAVDEHPFMRALGGIPSSCELTLHGPPERGPLTIRCSAAPIRRDGAVVGAIAIHADLSAQVRSAALLTAANRELEHFAAMASHDLQEPLRVVSNYLGLLESRLNGEPATTGTVISYITTMTRSIASMQSLITNLLRLARIGGGGGEPVWMESSAVLQEALHNLGERVGRTGATITWGRLPLVRADRTQLVLVFQNLLANAMKYARPGVPPTIRIEGQRRDDDVLFSVSDNGIGIDAKHRHEVFIAFRRLQPKADVPGSGLGLSICQKIVARHNGAIWVESQPGEGSTFFFTLGDQRDPPDGRQQPPAERDGALPHPDELAGARHERNGSIR
jgi:PAS domain S-box-containing protein